MSDSTICVLGTLIALSSILELAAYAHDSFCVVWGGILNASAASVSSKSIQIEYARSETVPAGLGAFHTADSESTRLNGAVSVIRRLHW